MKPVNPMDLGFLLMERRNQPMHVGGLILIKPPKGGAQAFMRRLITDVMAHDQPQPPFSQRLHRRAGVWFWEEDDAFDIEAHVHHLALPRPGRIRELLALVSKLHASLLDRSKPLWEVFAIEGVAGGRIALYTKVHHAMVDGVAAMRMMQKATATDPDARVIPLWALPPAQRGNRRAPDKPTPLTMMAAAAGKLQRQAGSVRTVAREVFESVRLRGRDPDYVSVFQAPRSILNRRISASRRFAAQSWSLDRIRVVGDARDATINDIILAMCASALRCYLQELDALPDKPLIAMVPVSMRTDDSEGGNQVAMILANLGTDLDDAQQRLGTIQRSMDNGKARFRRMSQGEVMAYLATVMAANGVNLALGINPSWQAFNIVISNVPGPKDTLYWNGAEVLGFYPVSIPIDGAALNITITSYKNQLEFGLTGCRRTLPHMQRLLGHLEAGLVELE